MSSSARAPSWRFPGVSILGLAVGLALIAGAATVAIPAFFGRPEVSLDNAAILLARDLRAAQNHAVVERKDMLVLFHPDGDGYRIVDEDGRPMPSPTGGADFDRRYSADAVFENVRISAVRSEPGQQVRFGRDGFSHSHARIQLSYRDETRTVRVRRGTGKVEIDGLRRPWEDDGR